MLTQNFKGLLTLVLIFSLLIGGFYIYKNVLEPKFISKEATQFPIAPESETEINPKIEIFSNKVIVSFDTPFETSGTVQYCLKGQYSNCKETAQELKTKFHKLEVTDLTPSTDYEYKIVIDDKPYPSDEKSSFKFTTKADTGLVTTPNAYSTKSTLTKEHNKLYTTTAPSSTKMTLQEFKNAMSNQDLKYDTDKDGKVTIKDYIP